MGAWKYFSFRRAGFVILAVTHFFYALWMIAIYLGFCGLSYEKSWFETVITHLTWGIALDGFHSRLFGGVRKSQRSWWVTIFSEAGTVISHAKNFHFKPKVTKKNKQRALFLVWIYRLSISLSLSFSLSLSLFVYLLSGYSQLDRKVCGFWVVNLYKFVILFDCTACQKQTRSVTLNFSFVITRFNFTKSIEKV